MSEVVTKDDLRQFGLLLMNDLRLLVETASGEKDEIHPEWLKSRVVRKIMDMSPGSLQNLRVSIVHHQYQSLYQSFLTGKHLYKLIPYNTGRQKYPGPQLTLGLKISGFQE